MAGILYARFTIALSLPTTDSIATGFVGAVDDFFAARAALIRPAITERGIRMLDLKQSMPGRESERESPLLCGPPRNICLIRLSAIGDTCHALPLIRSLQRRWPECRITWIIGRIEAKLMSLLPEIEFLTVDKRLHFAAEWAEGLRPQLAARRFDLLLHLHATMRANLLCALVRAPIKLGFDRTRARDLQWLFTNRRIRARRREHVLDSFWAFAEALGFLIAGSNGTSPCRPRQSRMRGGSLPIRGQLC